MREVLALLALSGQVPVDRGAADAEGPGDLGGLSPELSATAYWPL